MKVEIKINKDCPETTVVIETCEMTEEVQEIIKRISERKPKILSGEREEKIEILDFNSILYISTQDGRVFAKTQEGLYKLNYRLYELEEMLDSQGFARISNSDMVNLKKVKNFDLSLAGTICVKLINGEVLYASRRYVNKVKEILGRGGK